MENFKISFLVSRKEAPREPILLFLEREKRLELSTLGLESRCSSQLSYSRT